MRKWSNRAKARKARSSSRFRNSIQTPRCRRSAARAAPVGVDLEVRVVVPVGQEDQAAIVLRDHPQAGPNAARVPMVLLPADRVDSADPVVQEVVRQDLRRSR